MKSTFYIVTDANAIDYDYTPSGVKLAVWHSSVLKEFEIPFGETIRPCEDEYVDVSRTDYVGATTLRDGSLSSRAFDGGYFTFEASAPTPHIIFRDHLGNNRVVVNAKTRKEEQIQHYYPFGLPLPDSATIASAAIQPYKYNAKELDRMHGLTWYDYGARMYDPQLCRFTTVDPLADKYYAYSPYAYCVNNPVMLVDPDGMKVDTTDLATPNETCPVGSLISESELFGKYTNVLTTPILFLRCNMASPQINMEMR